MNYKPTNLDDKNKNINILKQIQKLLDKNQIDTAAQYMEEYMENNFVNNLYVLLKYAQILRLQTRYDEALPILKALLPTNNKNYALLEMIMIYIQKKDYQKASECIEQLKSIEDDVEQLKSLSFLDTLVRKQIEGEIVGQESHSLNITYSESRAIGHIIKHHCFDTHDESKGYFDQKINISDLFYKSKALIKNDNLKYYCTSNSLCYYFHYKNIGFDNNNQSTSVFVIIVNPLCGIITMYPISDTVDRSMLNNFEIKEKFDEGKSPKRISQIDKFYQRYGKKN